MLFFLNYIISYFLRVYGNRTDLYTEFLCSKLPELTLYFNYLSIDVLFFKGFSFFFRESTCVHGGRWSRERERSSLSSRRLVEHSTLRSRPEPKSRVGRLPNCTIWMPLSGNVLKWLYWRPWTFLGVQFISSFSTIVSVSNGRVVVYLTYLDLFQLNVSNFLGLNVNFFFLWILLWKIV